MKEHEKTPTMLTSKAKQKNKKINKQHKTIHKHQHKQRILTPRRHL